MNNNSQFPTIYQNKHTRIQSANIPRNIVPSKLYNTTRFNYILKQAGEFQNFEFNNDNPALQAYDENDYAPPNNLEETIKMNQQSNTQRPQTSVPRVMGVFDYTARHFPSLCENKLNYQNRTKLHQNQKFGKRSAVSALIQKSNNWQAKQTRDQSGTQDIKFSNLNQNKNKSQNTQGGIQIAQDIKTDGVSYFRFQNNVSGLGFVEIEFHNLKIEPETNNVSYMTVPDLFKIIKYKKQQLKEFFREFVARNQQTGNMQFQVSDFMEYYVDIDEKEEVSNYDEFIEEFQVTFPYISIFVEEDQETYIQNLTKQDIIQIINSGFEKLRDYANINVINGKRQQNVSVIHKEDPDEYEIEKDENQGQNIQEEEEQQMEDNVLNNLVINFDLDENAQVPEKIFKQNNKFQEEYFCIEVIPHNVSVRLGDGKQIKYGLSFQELLILQQMSEMQKPIDFIQDLIQIQQVELRQGKQKTILKLDFTQYKDQYSLENNEVNYQLTQRSINNGILRDHEADIEINNEQCPLTISPPMITITCRRTMEKSFRELSQAQLNQLIQNKFKSKIELAL